IREESTARFFSMRLRGNSAMELLELSQIARAFRGAPWRGRCRMPEILERGWKWLPPPSYPIRDTQVIQPIAATSANLNSSEKCNNSPWNAALRLLRTEKMRTTPSNCDPEQRLPRNSG